MPYRPQEEIEKDLKKLKKYLGKRGKTRAQVQEKFGVSIGTAFAWLHAIGAKQVDKNARPPIWVV